MDSNAIEKLRLEKGKSAAVCVDLVMPIITSAFGANTVLALQDANGGTVIVMNGRPPQASVAS